MALIMLMEKDPPPCKDIQRKITKITNADNKTQYAFKDDGTKHRFNFY